MILLKTICANSLLGQSNPQEPSFIHQIRDDVSKSFIDHGIRTAIIEPTVDYIKHMFEVKSFLTRIYKDSSLFYSYDDKFSQLVMDVHVRISVDAYIESIINPATRSYDNDLRMNSLLLAGPPGTGKTEVMRHIAITLKKRFKKVMVYFLIGSHLIIKDEEQSIRILSKLFQRMTQHVKRGGIAYLAIDEADSILSNSNNMGNRSGLLTHLLSLMSGMELLNASLQNNGQFLFVVSTNLPQAITPAFARRLTHINFSLPSYSVQTQVFQQYLKKYSGKNPSLTVKIKPQQYERILKLFCQSLTHGFIENIVKLSCLIARHLLPRTRVLTLYCLLHVLRDELYKHYTVIEKLQDAQAKEKIQKLQPEIDRALKEHNEIFLPAEMKLSQNQQGRKSTHQSQNEQSGQSTNTNNNQNRKSTGINQQGRKSTNQSQNQQSGQ